MHATVACVLDVWKTGLLLAKYPLGLALAIYLVTHAYRDVADRTANSLQTGAEKLCTYPVISLLTSCAHIVDPPTSSSLSSTTTSSSSSTPSVTSSAFATPSSAPHDFPLLMRLQNVALDELSGQAAIGSTLALNLKQTEYHVKDLINAVEASNMSVKATLADALSSFASDARVSARRLQELSTKILSFMDGCVIFLVSEVQLFITALA